MGMAVLSPCPLLVNDTSGGVIIVSTMSGLVYSNNTHLMQELNATKTLQRSIWKYFFKLTSLCSTGVGLDPLRSHSVLCEGDHRGDPA